MKNRFKKTLNTFEIAVQISMSVSDEIDYIEKLVAKYCKEDERLLKYKAKMLDESQWLADACGISTVAFRNPDVTADVVTELIKVYISIDEHNGGGTMFSEKNMEHVFQILLRYLKEFMKGVDEENGSSKAFDRGLIYLCDVYNVEVFGGYPKPGSSIDEYTQELSQHFFILFNNKLSKFNLG